MEQDGGRTESNSTHPAGDQSQAGSLYNPSQAEGISLETEPCRNVQLEREREREGRTMVVLSQTVLVLQATRAKLEALEIPSQAEGGRLEPC